MRRSVADQVKSILQELDLPIGTEAQNTETLHKFLADHGYQGIKNYPLMKNFYDEFKTKYKKEVLQYYNVDLMEGDDLDTKLNELLQSQHLKANPKFGWPMKSFERRKAGFNTLNPSTQQRSNQHQQWSNQEVAPCYAPTTKSVQTLSSRANPRTLQPKIFLKI